MNKNWYKKTWWGIVLAAFFIFPFSIWWLWAKSNLEKNAKWTLTGIITVFFIIIACSGGSGAGFSFGLSLLLLLASAVLLIIGLIDPTIIGNWFKLKKNLNRKLIALAGTGLIVFFIVMLCVSAIHIKTPNIAVASSPKISANQSSNAVNPTADKNSASQPTTNQISNSLSTQTPESQNNNQQVQNYSAPTITKTSQCQENNGLPDSSCTPGAIDPKVTQSNINQTICVSGYTTTVRPSTSYTNNLKTQQIKAYGYSDTSLSSYEEDHLIPLEIGGSPTDPANLWPEPYNITYGARAKDKVENYLHAQICSGAMTLAEAQKQDATNWESVYNSHYGTLNGGSGSNSSNSPTSGTSSGSTPSSTSSATKSSSIPTATPNNSVPAGSTGKCNDGTYTSAVHHQGACSRHGGVANWF
jgi:hypothetical protein